jgi:hypothetical protein
MGSKDYRVGFAMLVQNIPVAGVSEGIAPGLKTAWVRAPQDTTQEAALAEAVAEYPLSNEQLLAYAARNPPPQTWYDEDEDLF